MRILPCYEEIQKKKKPLFRKTSVLDFFIMSSTGTRALSPALMGAGYDDIYHLPAVQEEVPPP
jgi:hypothetical protein